MPRILTVLVNWIDIPSDIRPMNEVGHGQTGRFMVGQMETQIRTGKFRSQ